MPPKKAAAAPKKKKDGAADGGELQAEDKAKLYMYTCTSLQLQLAERSDEAAKALADKRAMKETLENLSSEFNEEKNINFELTQEMTRHYRGMQQELLDRINRLEETIILLKDKLATSEMRQERVVKEKDIIIANKDNEIVELKMKMDDMADEFSQMLKDTLDKMREKIDLSSSNMDPTVLPIHQRMNQISIGRK